MKISKDFRWEMGHRLPFHKGKCKNLHGHSYKLRLEFTGKPDENGMVIDYYEIKKLVSPLIEKLDHSFLVCKNDKELVRVLDELNSRYILIDSETTAENICLYLLNEMKGLGFPSNVSKIKARLYETESAYAEDEIDL